MDLQVNFRQFIKLFECYLTNSQNLQISFFLLFCMILEKSIALIMSYGPDGIVGNLLMDPLKVYDCVNNELVVVSSIRA